MSLLLIVAIVLAIVDARITYERLQAHPSLELNPLVRWLATRVGVMFASLLGVCLIQILVAVALMKLTDSGLALFVGAGLYRTYTQALSLRYF